MATALTSLLNQLSWKDEPALADLERLRRPHAAIVPDVDDVQVAIKLGRPEVVNAILSNPTLKEGQRQRLANEGMVAFLKNPLAFQEPVSMARVLRSHGALAGVDLSNPKNERVSLGFDRLKQQLQAFQKQEGLRQGQRGGTHLTGGTQALSKVHDELMAEWSGLPSVGGWRDDRKADAPSPPKASSSTPRIP